MNFKAGDRVLYVLPKSPANGRPTELRLPATVSTVTKRRIVIRLVGQTHHRNVLATSLLPETAA